MDALALLNDRQREAVMHNGTPLLILAGAGSGKTRVITAKISFLIDELKTDPRSILAVTFTNKAAAEMKERASALSPKAESAMIKTFHSFGAFFLRKYAMAVGLDPEFNILDDDDSTALLRKLFPEFKTGECRGLYSLIQSAKDSALTVFDDLSEFSMPDFPDLYAAYEKRLGEINCVDFGDLILKPLLALRNDSHLKKQIHSRYKVILVDEYQDTNTAQFQLLKEMKGDETYLCVVGDEDQSIYGFRGAQVKNILTFPENFPYTETIRLEQNYRSVGKILKAADSVICRNKHRLGKTLWTSSSEEGVCELHYLEDGRAEAEFCAGILSDGQWEQSAVLYRTNAQAAVFEQVFRQKRIPYTTLGTTGFFERKEIKDLLSFLRLLANPNDFPAFQRIINRPPRGIGEKRLESLSQSAFSYGGNLLKAAGEMARTGDKSGKLKQFCSLFSEFSARDDFRIDEAAAFFLKESGLPEFYEKEDSYSGMEIDREENIRAFLDLASSYGCGREELRRFLDSLALDNGGGRTREASGVRLATIHNTKGLEFDRVFVTGVEEGFLPSSLTEDIEEERRLFYVAVTRAKKALYITSVNRRTRYGKTEDRFPSVFLSELDRDAVTIFDESSKEALQYPTGALVFHEKYGRGQVLRSVNTGSQTVVQVIFRDGIVRQILPRYTMLEVLSRNGYGEYE